MTCFFKQRFLLQLFSPMISFSILEQTSTKYMSAHHSNSKIYLLSTNLHTSQSSQQQGWLISEVILMTLCFIRDVKYLNKSLLFRSLRRQMLRQTSSPTRPPMSSFLTSVYRWIQKFAKNDELLSILINPCNNFYYLMIKILDVQVDTKNCKECQFW